MNKKYSPCLALSVVWSPHVLGFGGHDLIDWHVHSTPIVLKRGIVICPECIGICDVSARNGFWRERGASGDASAFPTKMRLFEMGHQYRELNCLLVGVKRLRRREQLADKTLVAGMPFNVSLVSLSLSCRSLAWPMITSIGTLF
ncbi:hypothetical protein AA313_de0208777 [Arthrobotrys entomopaga]|nr:hypothetical protein AA313_de0208777 [Arthrobotrys entomopaga]